jgi:hypothetical protein
MSLVVIRDHDRVCYLLGNHFVLVVFDREDNPAGRVRLRLQLVGGTY